MFQNLSLRAKLIAIAVPPLVVLVCIALYGLLLSVNGAQENLAGDVRTLGIIAIAGVILTAAVGFLVQRTIADPVEEITAATRDLADNRLPRLVDALRSNNAGETHFEPITFEQNDELGELAGALNDVQAAATNVAVEQQTLIRKGVSEIVINMARRNQTLLDRQIEFIDTLESAEEDPERLEQLFGLDHLATRMRRNAESLLVLAGAESARRRGGPVAVADVLRVAMSEIEDYRHVQLHAVEECDIAAASAVDLAHLLSELMENSTQFSPPDAPVEVSGTTHPDGSYLISIVDHGIGMNDEQLAAANQTIAKPPALGLNLSRSLGFIVVGRLAQRLDVRIELVQTSGGGTTAIIEVPQSSLNAGAAPQDHGAPQEHGESAPDMSVAAIDAPDAPSPMDAGSYAPAQLTAPAALGTPGMPVINDPAPSLSENPFGSADLSAEEPAWTPPVVPERGANPIGGSTPDIAPDIAPDRAAEMPEPAGSDALAKLQGLAPTDMPSADIAPAALPPVEMPPVDMPPVDMPPVDMPPVDLPPLDMPSAEIPTAEMPPVEMPSAEIPSAEMPSFDAPAFDAPAFDAPAPEAPAFEQAPPTEHVQPGPAPSKLEEAIPTGDAFDQGMDNLLDDGGSRTPTGLVKRDRSKSKAPTSEGRRIPDGSTAAVASSRSPEEIRSMLARYREGLKGRPLEGLAQEAHDSTTENNPFGDNA